MIQWRDPLAAATLVLVPALVVFLVWAWRRRQRALDAFVAAALLPVVAPDVDPRRRRLRAALLVLATACLALALAGPMWGFRWEEVRREGIDLIVALDTSRSMLATDVKPNRLARAKLAVQDLLGELKGDRIGLVAFAGSAFVQCPLTLDRGAFSESLAAVEVGIIPRGGTALGAAIESALEAFEGRQGRHQALVLVTDGESNEGDVDAAIKQATERGVKVYTVGIGTPEGELLPGEGGAFFKDRAGQVVKSRLDEGTLEKIAVDTGGIYLRAGGASLGLVELYRDYIAGMEKRELASTLERRFEHRFQWPLLLAFVLLLVEPLLGERRAAARGAGRLGRLFRRRVAAAVVLAALGSGSPARAWWLDPHAQVREANRLYEAGKYEDAATRYNQALTDDPDSLPAHFNLGNATYKDGKYTDALNAWQQVPTGDADPARTARVAYSIGNAKYRLGAEKEASEPQAALGLWAEALAAYRRALGAAPDDADAKFNHELVTQKIAELKKKLEEQQKEKEQQQQDQQQQQDEQQDQEQKDQPQDQQGDQQPQEQEKQEAQQPEEKQEDEQQAQQPPAREQPKDRPKDDAQQAAAAQAKPGGEMTQQEAQALLDSQRDQEVRPDEVIRQLQGAVEVDPAQDW